MKKIHLLRITKKIVAETLNLSSYYINKFTPTIYPPLPTTLNLMINDICNSRCLMCNVWKQKQTKELSPEELETILKDPLFKKLNYVGVSGGEPTLRNDLPEIFQVITAKKTLKGTGLITNAIQADRVIEQVNRCYNICTKNNIPFNVMISLDGIGKIHDMIRGKKGNFASTCKVLRYLRDNTDIPLTIGCTAVKENVWLLDEVLDFCRKENIQGRFRIAEFINRLYNHNLGKSIRNFNDDEKYHLALFFFKLERSYEKNPSVQATYVNIRKMIFETRHRQSGCPYQSQAVGLNSAGNLIYCSPQSPVLGSCLQKSAIKLFRENIHLRNAIIENNCCNCIHDYHSQPAASLIREGKAEGRFKAEFSVDMALKNSSSFKAVKTQALCNSTIKNPLIIGWYGTETAGDKAILWNIIKRLKNSNPETHITIASIYPFVTERTLHELAIENIKIIKTYSSQYLEACKTADAVIMGGGPLMDMDPLGFVLQGFLTARKNDIPTLIEGCGIGPIVKNKYKTAVKEIIRLSSEIKVRDKASLDWIVKNTGRIDATCTGDNATGFVKDWMKDKQLIKEKPPKPYFACFLREITMEYSLGMSTENFFEFRKNFEDNLARMIIVLMDKTGLEPFIVPMHTFVIGNDDRDFARRFSNTYLQNRKVRLGCKIYSPQDILIIMTNSQFNLCMRFHSVLFAETLKTPFIAIDYTGGGKVKGFLLDKNKEKFMLDRSQLANGTWKDSFERIMRKLETKNCYWS